MFVALWRSELKRAEPSKVKEPQVLAGWHGFVAGRVALLPEAWIKESRCLFFEAAIARESSFFFFLPVVKCMIPS